MRRLDFGKLCEQFTNNYQKSETERAKAEAIRLGNFDATKNCFDTGYWSKICGDIVVDNRDNSNETERKRVIRETRVWRKDTFQAFYRLKFNAKRKTVQRVIRKDLSAGLWCRHVANDDNFNSGYVPKMAGFSERTAFGNIINVDAETPSTIVPDAFERYPELRIGTENRPTRIEHRKNITRNIWRNGQKDTIEDSTTYVEWRERIVATAAFSNRVSFDFTLTDESEKVGEFTRKEFREKSCERWIEPRLSAILADGSGGELLPQNTLAECDDGRKIPNLDLANWKLGTDGYILDSIPRYIVKSVLSSFRLNIVGGNAANNGGLRCAYNGKQRSDIRHEFVQECLQEIALAHLECLRCIKKFVGILNGALSRTITRFVRLYCSGGNNRDRSAVIERTRKNANALAQKLAGFVELQYQDEVSERTIKGLTMGLTQTEIARNEGVSQQTISKRIKETIALNRVLAQLAKDAE